MQIEDKLPEIYKRNAFHPNAFTYAWKRKNIEKLLEELLKSNIAVMGGEVWLEEDTAIETLIPLKNGKIEIFNWEIKPNDQEEWYDLVERSIKETTQLLNDWNLERNVRVDKADKIYYHFNLAEN